MKVGIIGAGRIAGFMATALRDKPQGCEVYAIASRSLEKAQAFAAQYGIPKAYGSYEEMLADANIELVYVATPHSHHFAHAGLSLDYGKPCLVEKSFTANEREARELITKAHSKGLFITEAIWTRYMPLSLKIKDLLDSGIIGEPRVLTATLCYMNGNKERMLRPELCGGALLDLGVYVINFARMYFGDDIVRSVSNCFMGPTGVDTQECISLAYRDGRMANLQAGSRCLNDRQGIISGTEGYIRVDNVNCPEKVEVYRNYELVASYTKADDMVNGYEYEVFECKRCIEEGLGESPLMPHAETLAIMRQMDALRKEWGVHYPADEIR